MKVALDKWNWTRAETLDFVARMRESDAREALGMTGARGALLADMIRSDVTDTAERGGVAFGARMDGRPCAVFAAAPDSPMSDSAAIWMLSSRECEARPVAFARWSLRGFRALCEALPGVDTFWNWTQETGCGAGTRRWLSWLGAWFSVSERIISPWSGETFVKLFMERRG